MKVLLAGGTGLVGRSVLRTLLARGDHVRVLARTSTLDRTKLERPESVEIVHADVTRLGSLSGVADGCDAAINLVGIIEQHPPDGTYERVNVAGTANLLRELDRARVPRLVHVSCLHAERRSSEFQRSKWQGEQLVRRFSGDWLVVRPGGVYGPHDESITVLLRMVRALRVAPIVGSGLQPWQPIWHEDLGRALAEAVHRSELCARVLLVAGNEVTTSRELIQRFSKRLERRVVFAPIPAAFASSASRLSRALGFAKPLNTAKLTMLLEGSVIEPASDNALERVLGIQPLPLREGLEQLVTSLPVQSPEHGYGKLVHKRFEGTLASSSCSPEQLMAKFRDDWESIMPIDFRAEPKAPERLDFGVTLSARLPGRGNILMRVCAADERQVTMLTVKGHPIAGLVRFSVDECREGVAFRVDVFARPATRVDHVGIVLFGRALQNAQWTAVVRGALKAAGARGHIPVRRSSHTLRGPDRERVVRWFDELNAAAEADPSEAALAAAR